MRKYSTFIWTILLCLFLLLPATAFPQELNGGIANDRVNKSETTNLQPDVEVLTYGEILRSGALNAAQALERLAGIRVSVGSDGVYRLSIRGLDTQQIAFFVDDVPARSIASGEFDPALLPTSLIEKIVVEKNPATSLKGPDSPATVVRITTRESIRGLPFRTEGLISDSGSPMFSLSQGARLAPVALFLAAGYGRSDGFHLSDSFESDRNEDGGERDNSDKETLNLLAGIRVTPLEDTAFHANFNYLDAAYGLPPHVSLSEPGYLRMDDKRSWSLSVGGETAFADRFAFSLRFLLNDSREILDAYDDDSYSSQDTDQAFRNTVESDSAGLHGTGDLDFGRFSLVRIALWYRRDAHRQRTQNKGPWDKYVRDAYSIGIEDVLRPWNPLSITVGAGFNGTSPQFASDKEEGEADAAVDPSVGLTWKPFESTTARIAWNARTRFPTLEELHPSVGEGFSDPDLKKQTAYGTDLGLTQAIGPWADLGATVFHYRVRELICLPPADGGTRQLDNLNSLDLFGAEATIFLHPWKWISWRTAYSFLMPEEEAAEDAGLEYRPDHMIDSNLGVSFDFGFEANLIASWVSGQEYLDPRSGRRKTLGEYAVLDAVISLRLWPGFRLFAMGKNLGDFDYQTAFGYPQPGREILFGARINLDLSGIPE